MCEVMHKLKLGIVTPGIVCDIGHYNSRDLEVIL